LLERSDRVLVVHIGEAGPFEVHILGIDTFWIGFERLSGLAEYKKRI